MSAPRWKMGDRVIILGAWKHTDGTPRLVRGTVRECSPNAKGGSGLVVVKLDDFRRCRSYSVKEIEDEPIIDQLVRLDQ